MTKEESKQEINAGEEESKPDEQNQLIEKTKKFFDSLAQAAIKNNQFFLYADILQVYKAAYSVMAAYALLSEEEKKEYAKQLNDTIQGHAASFMTSMMGGLNG